MDAIDMQPLTPSAYGERGVYKSGIVLAVGRSRFEVGYVSPVGSARRVYQGPVLPGPYAYAYSLPVVLDNYGGSGAESRRMREAGTEITAQVGDRITMDGHTFEIMPAANHNIDLRLIDPALDLTDPQVGDILSGWIQVVEVLPETENGRPVVMASWLNHDGTPGLPGRLVVGEHMEISHRPR